MWISIFIHSPGNVHIGVEVKKYFSFLNSNIPRFPQNPYDILLMLFVCSLQKRVYVSTQQSGELSENENACHPNAQKQLKTSHIARSYSLCFFPSSYLIPCYPFGIPSLNFSKNTNKLKLNTCILYIIYKFES